MSTLGRKTPSIAGSRMSVYSQGSTVRTLRTMNGRKSTKPNKIPWYKKPLITHAFYTDLQTGSWHIGFYTLFLSLWTMFTSGFDIYCLNEATPGTSHTGYYIISFDFVYVGNPHVRNLLIMSAVFSLLGSFAILVTSIMLLDALRKEEEIAFEGWLWVMGIFTIWKWVAWAYAAVVNDLIFAYNIIMFIAWLILNILNVFSFICIYSLYLELNDLTKLQDLARLKVDAGSSVYGGSNPRGPGSRPPSIMSGGGTNTGIYTTTSANNPSYLEHTPDIFNSIQESEIL